MARSHHNRTETQSTEVSQRDRERMRNAARQLTDRDTPDEAPAGHKKELRPSSGHDTYRPDANVDNEQHSHRKAGRDLQQDTFLVPGAPVSRDKTSRKAAINDKAQKAKSSRRNG